ncbi:hypothetical protein FB451DRAFT_1389265 [Mycena latifolia]|nr:hypothetical protein FB451DRAFT_1389265 [Mycena latifolia]
MAFSSALHSPPQWIVFRLAALKRASRVIRRLTPPHALDLRADRSEKPPSAGNPLDEFIFIEVEQTLFKVHISLFRLELWSPVQSDNSAHSSRQNNTADPVVLSDTAENFRYFLWDLQAFPHELSHMQDGDSDTDHVVGRLLNIAEMANKHSLSSLEARALESLRHFVLSPYFHSASSTQHCRALSLAIRSTAGHALLRDLSRRLIQRIVRHPSPDPALIRLIEQDQRLRTIQGAVYYRQLVDMEQHLPGQTAAQPVFPPSMDVERRMRFLAAHISLSALSARLFAAAPPLPPSGCPSHSMCSLAWEDMWAQATATCQSPSLGSADVLGRLRTMAPVLNRMVSEAPTMTVECGLAALEAIGSLRDDIIDGLMNHFA